MATEDSGEPREETGSTEDENTTQADLSSTGTTIEPDVGDDSSTNTDGASEASDPDESGGGAQSIEDMLLDRKSVV